MSWKHLEQNELLSGELVIAEKSAFCIVKLSDYNLRSVSYQNWGGTEQIYGKLHLTNYRLVFASGALNRVAGRFSIFLPTIQKITKWSFLLTRRMEIGTESQGFEFQFWGVPAFIARIESTRDSIDATGREELVAKVIQEYPTLGEDFKISKAINTYTEVLASLTHVIGGLQGGNPLRQMLNSESPPTISRVLNVLELLGENTDKNGEKTDKQRLS